MFQFNPLLVISTQHILYLEFPQNSFKQDQVYWNMKNFNAKEYYIHLITLHLSIIHSFDNREDQLAVLKNKFRFY